MARRRGGRAPNVHWTGFGASALSFAAGTVASTLSVAAHGTETLMRTRGSLVGFGDGALVTGAMAIISVGFILVPEGSGTTVTWSPRTDRDAPWFYWTSFVLAYEEYVTDVIWSSQTSEYREVIDSKAMRVQRNQEVQFVAENTTLGGAMTVNLAVEGRFLSQE